MQKIILAYNRYSMKNKVHILTIVAAVLLGALFGAVIKIIPELTLRTDARTATIIHIIVAIVMGIALVGYIWLVRQIKKRDGSN